MALIAAKGLLAGVYAHVIREMMLEAKGFLAYFAHEIPIQAIATAVVAIAVDAGVILVCISM